MKNIIQSQKGFLQIPIMISVGLLIVVGAYFGIVKYGSNNTEQLKSTASQIGKDVAESEVKSLKQEVAALKKQVENKPNPFDFLSAPTVQTNTNAINRQSEALKEIDRKLFELYEDLKYARYLLNESFVDYSQRCDTKTTLFGEDVATCKWNASKNLDSFAKDRDQVLRDIDEYEKLRIRVLAQ